MTTKPSRTIAVIGGDTGCGDSARQVALELGKSGLEVTLYDPGEGRPDVPGLESVTVRNGRIVQCRGGVGRFEVESVHEGTRSTEHFGVLVFGTGSRALPLSQTYGPLPEEAILSSSQFLLRLEQDDLGREQRLVAVLGLAGNHSPLLYRRTLEGLRQAIHRRGSRVAVITDQVRVASPGNEELYRELREMGTLFFKIEGPDSWSVHEEKGGLVVNVFDWVLRQQHRLPADILVFEERYVPAGQRFFWSPHAPRTDRQGYLQEAHAHLDPGATNRKGIFAVGSCRGWTDVEDLTAQVKAVALEVRLLLVALEGGVGSDGDVAEVDEGKCALCLTCMRFCPRGAISYGQGALVSPADCDGCGICVGACPARAITLEPRNMGASRNVGTQS